MPTEEQTYREGVKQDLAEIKAMVRYTNGKVRKITIALTLISGVVIGQAFSGKELIMALIHAL